MIREYIRKLLLPADWLQDAAPQVDSLGAEADGVLDEAGAGAQAGMLAEAPAVVGAVPYHGRNSGGLAQAAGETAAAYWAYLRDRWRTWQRCGTVEGLQQQLARIGYPAAEIWTELDLKLAQGGTPFGGHQGFFFIILRKPHAIVSQAVNWGGGALWNGGALWGGTNLTSAQVEAVKSAIRRWKPASTTCRFVVFELDPAKPLVLGFGPQLVSTGLGAALRSVWASSPTAVWAVGEAGVALWYDGATWSADSSTPAVDLRSVWGDPLGGRWAVGASGTALQTIDPALGAFAGWSPITVSGTPSLRGVWSDGVAAWACGDSGAVRRYVAGSFQTVVSGIAEDLLACWGAAANDVWFVGTGGAILHWNGATISAVANPGGGAWRGVWGSGPSDVWAVGDGGRIARWNGAAWALVPSGTTENLTAVSGSSATNVWAVGAAGGARRWDGAAWSYLPSKGTSLAGVWAADARNGWAVGDGGVSVRWGPSEWGGGDALTVPVGERWEMDPVTGGAREFYSYSYLRERVT